MELICLIKLLLEKEIIKQNHLCKIDNKTVLLTYGYEYQEVCQKILDTVKNDKLEYLHVEHDTSKKEIQFINLDNLKELIMKENKNKEEFFWNPYNHQEGQSGSLRPVKYKEWLTIVNKIDGLTNYGRDDGTNVMRIRNNIIRDKRLEKEKQKKEEVLNFINSLP